MRTAWRALVGLTATLALLPAPASAAPSWQPREKVGDVSTTQSFVGSWIGADGVTKVTGSRAPPPANPALGNRERLAVRPTGGPLGAYAALPGGIGNSFGLLGLHDAAGNMLVADGTQVAYRPAGAGTAVGSLQNLGGGNGVEKLAITTTGEALVGLVSAGNPARVAYRPAGAGAQVDVAGAQTLPSSSGANSIIGMALDPAGSAVVVYKTTSNVLVQTTRSATDPSFGTPVPVVSSTGQPAPSADFYASPAGWAVLTWQEPTGPTSSAVMASVRQPGGSFSAAVNLGSGADPRGAVDSNGHALVAWTLVTSGNDPSCITVGGSSYGARVGIYDNGTWAFQGAGPATWPNTSLVPTTNSPNAPQRAVAGAGGTLALVTEERFDVDACNVADGSSQLVVRRTGPTPAGYGFVDSTVLQASVPRPSDGRHVLPDLKGVDVEPAGRVVASFFQFPDFFVRPFEDPGAPPPPPPPPPGGGGSPGPGGQPGTPPPRILPLVPRNLVLALPLNPVKPIVRVTCPPSAADECRFVIDLRMAFGASPRAAARRRTVVIGSARARVAPGRKKRVLIKLNRRGRRVVARRRAVRVKVVTKVVSGTQRGTTTKTTTLKAKRRRR